MGTVELDGQYRVLRESAGVLERDERRLLACRGPDAVAYVHDQITNDVESLETGYGCYAALLDRKGRMQTDLRVLRIADDEVLLECDQVGRAALGLHLGTYRVGRDVDFEDRAGSHSVLSVIGPAAVEAIGAGPLGAENAHREVEVRGAPVRAVATDLGADLICPSGDVAKVREAVGGRVRFMVSGSAALPAHIGQFFYGCGLTVMEGYGLTETSPVLTVTPHTGVRFGAVGKAIPGVDLKIADDGEILARGPNIMQGYYNKPAETAEVLKDGWFHTGDIGSIDADGYLRITDRKKDLIVTAGGKKIAPQPLEARLKSHPVVAEAIVIGEGRRFPAALFVPNGPALAAALGAPPDTDPMTLVDRPGARALYQAALDDVNRELGQFEKLKKFGFLPRPLTQADNELTPTLKVRRKVIEEKYRDVIARLYADSAPA